MSMKKVCQKHKLLNLVQKLQEKKIQIGTYLTVVWLIECKLTMILTINLNLVF